MIDDVFLEMKRSIETYSKRFYLPLEASKNAYNVLGNLKKLKNEAFKQIKDNLTDQLYENIKKLIDKIDELLLNMVEVRQEIVGTGDGKINKTLIRTSIDALIGKMDAGINILFFSSFRQKFQRKHNLKICILDLIILDTFLEN